MMDLSKLDRICERVRDTFGIPSLSAAFYVAGEHHNCSLGCSENTMFAIGSCTKSFSAGTVMALEDDGLLSADDRVKQHIKNLKLSDPALEEKLSIRDILCHRSGLAGCDLAWYPYHDNFIDADLMKAVSLLPKTAECGEKHQYNNMVFALSGKLIENCAKKDWKEAIIDKIIGPLGIKSYAFSAVDAEKLGTVAVPFIKSAEGIKEVPHAFTASIGPAGSLYMTAPELIKWNVALLHDGEFDERRILSSKAVLLMEEALIPDEAGPDIAVLNEAMKDRSYGLGLQMGKFRGEKLVYHGGAIDGFLANQSFLPEKDCASVMLTDLGSTYAREAFMYAVNGFYLGDDTDWIAIFAEAQKKYDRDLMTILADVPFAFGTEVCSDISGCYFNPLFGELEIFFDNSRYKARIGNFIMPAQLEDNIFSFRHVEFGILESEIIKNSSGVITSLLVPADPSITRKFEFIKKERP